MNEFEQLVRAVMLEHDETSASGGYAAALTRVAARRRRRFAMLASAAAVVLVAIVAVAISLTRIGSSNDVAQSQPVPHRSPPTPSASTPVPSRTREPHVNLTAGFVAERIVRSSGDGVVLEAPAGMTRWTLNASCSVELRWLDGSNEGGGAGGTGCPFAAHLSVGAGGDFYMRPVWFGVLGGRVMPASGVLVRVTLANGHTMTYVPQHSYWLSIVQRCGDFAGTRLVTVTAIDRHGTVLATDHIPQSNTQPHQPQDCT